MFLLVFLRQGVFQCLLHLTPRTAAAIDGRDFVIPDDVKAVAVPVLAHRVIPHSQGTVRLTDTNEKLIEFVLDSVPAPLGND